MAVEDADTSRTRVQTYVPAYQKETWREHADELDMSLSEFVRSMVQAGRQGFDGETRANSEQGRSTPSSSDDPQGKPLEDRVIEVLDDGGYYDWDELVAELTDGIEERLDSSLRDLQDEGRVTYSGRNGGYTLK
ncbi:MAG: DUF5805 domain-containing protein [Haloarculaceae archaeon]